MSNLQMIERLCTLLEEAGRIIRDQAELLAQHGISTDEDRLERSYQNFLEEMETDLNIRIG